MDEVKRSCWYITSQASVTEKVYFEEEVTEDQAKALYLEEEYDDIMDTNVEDIIRVMSVR